MNVYKITAKNDDGFTTTALRSTPEGADKAAAHFAFKGFTDIRIYVSEVDWRRS